MVNQVHVDAVNLLISIAISKKKPYHNKTSNNVHYCHYVRLLVGRLDGWLIVGLSQQFHIKVGSFFVYSSYRSTYSL